MKKTELIKTIAQRTEKTQKETAEFLENFLTVIGEELSNGRKVQIPGFGTFEVRERSERTGRNPQTGEVITIKATKLPAFKAGKSLKELIKK